jgi:Na+-driven multidrug efflux pump
VYFTLRSGGKTWITFLFDCGAIWALMLPLAFCLTRFTSLPIIPVYIFCNAVDAVKCAVGVVMIRKGNWVQNLAIK